MKKKSLNSFLKYVERGSNNVRIKNILIKSKGFLEKFDLSTYLRNMVLNKMKN